jgi:hypothetical protein
MVDADRGQRRIDCSLFGNSDRLLVFTYTDQVLRLNLGKLEQ